MGQEAVSRAVAAQDSHVVASQAEVQGQALSFAPVGSGHQLELGCQESCMHFCCGSPQLAGEPFMKTLGDPHHSPGF